MALVRPEGRPGGAGFTNNQRRANVHPKRRQRKRRSRLNMTPSALWSSPVYPLFENQGVLDTDPPPPQPCLSRLPDNIHTTPRAPAPPVGKWASPPTLPILDPVDRDVVFTPTKTAYDPRHMIAGTVPGGRPPLHPGFYHITGSSPLRPLLSDFLQWSLFSHSHPDTALSPESSLSPGAWDPRRGSSISTPMRNKSLFFYSPSWLDIMRPLCLDSLTWPHGKLCTFCTPRFG